MNWRRGLFRLWLVVSALWIGWLTLGFSLSVWSKQHNVAIWEENCATRRDYPLPCPPTFPGAFDNLMGYPRAFYDLMGYIVYAFGLPLALLGIGFFVARFADGYRSTIKNG